MRISDWSSDVCSSDLVIGAQRVAIALDLVLHPRRVADDEAVAHEVVELRREATGRLIRLAAPACVGLVFVDERSAHLVQGRAVIGADINLAADRVILGLRSEEHTSELQSLMRNSYAVFCLKKKNTK